MWVQTLTITVVMEVNHLQYIKAMRLFKDEPKWTPLNRGPEVDVNTHRKGYLQSRGSQAVAAN